VDARTAPPFGGYDCEVTGDTEFRSQRSGNERSPVLIEYLGRAERSLPSCEEVFEGGAHGFDREQSVRRLRPENQRLRPSRPPHRAAENRADLIAISPFHRHRLAGLSILLKPSPATRTTRCVVASLGIGLAKVQPGGTSTPRGVRRALYDGALISYCSSYRGDPISTFHSIRWSASNFRLSRSSPNIVV
jgi:hypothetical protein